MKYDFTTLPDRRGKDAIAVDGVGNGGFGFAPEGPKEGFDLIPMWVADMNFMGYPGIKNAIIARAEQPTLGYFMPRDEYYEKIIRWHSERNAVSGLLPENIGYENGVLGGVVSAVRTLCSAGDNVLLHSPTYIGFTHCLTDNGYNIVLSPMYQDRDGIWRMDYEDMERRIVKNRIHCAIFCSPHNPTGRVWSREEIEKAMEIYARHDVTVISDEIWSDIILPGNKHIPTQSVSEDARNRTIALYAPSKTFNLAGLIGSYHIVYNRRLRERMEKESSLCYYNGMNVLSMHALLGAYTDGGMEWVEELRQVIGENVSYACEFISENFEGVKCAKPQGTYMLFLDCAEWCEDHMTDIDSLLKSGWDVGVAWQDGRDFHGSCHIRMNLALPKERVEEAFRRLKEYVF